MNIRQSVPQRNEYTYLILSLSALMLGISLAIGLVFATLRKQPTTLSQSPSMPTALYYSPKQPSVLLSPTLTPTPFLNPILTYTSSRLGIRFHYAQYESPAYPAIKGFTKEIGNKIYLYYDRQEYTGIDENYLNQYGQYLEVFSKDPQNSLETAIQKQFLQGFSGNDCIVRDISGQMPTSLYPPHYLFAEMDYKWLEGYDYNVSATCSSPYTRTNAIAYFLSNPNYPNKYVFIGPHQNPAMADYSHTWDETIIFF